jgi:hypothetical protein
MWVRCWARIIFLGGDQRAAGFGLWRGIAASCGSVGIPAVGGERSVCFRRSAASSDVRFKAGARRELLSASRERRSACASEHWFNSCRARSAGASAFCLPQPRHFDSRTDDSTSVPCGPTPTWNNIYEFPIRGQTNRLVGLRLRAMSLKCNGDDMRAHASAPTNVT